MFKKKYFLLLSTLLLTVLLGFCTSSYAFVPTENELKNFICNYAQFYNANYDISTLKANLDNHSTDLQNWLVYLNRYEGRYILSGANGNIYMWVYTGSDNDLRLYAPWERTDYYYVDVNSSYLSRWRWGYNLARNEFSNYTSDNVPVRTATQSYFFYTDTNIYTNPTKANGTLKYSSGYSNPSWDLFSSFYHDSYFDIDINADFRNNKATISNDTSGTEYYLVPYSADKIRIGNMFDYSNLAAVVKRKFRYKKSTRSFDLIQEFQSDTNNLDYYDIADDTLIVFEYSQPDTTEFITFIPKEDTGFSQFTIPIYYTSYNTQIVNGVVDTDTTFSGDNYTNYNNDTNTDKIIDNTNDDSNVNSIIDDNLSGDVNSFSEKLGYSPLENPFLAVIRFVLEGICNTLLGTGDQTLEFEFQGETISISSQDFSTPPGLLTTFMSGVLVTFYLFAFYKYGFHIYEKLQSGEFTSVIKSFSSDNNNDYKEM